MVNQTLRRIYEIYPSIGAWAKSGLPSPLWPSRERARLAMAEYFGPAASWLFMRSRHVEDPKDQEFIRSLEALAAMCAIVDAIYLGRPLIGGLLPEEEQPRA
jgi:hypothetical protein